MSASQAGGIIDCAAKICSDLHHLRNPPYFAKNVVVTLMHSMGQPAQPNHATCAHRAYEGLRHSVDKGARHWIALAMGARETEGCVQVRLGCHFTCYHKVDNGLVVPQVRFGTAFLTLLAVRDAERACEKDKNKR